jgi:hypothetical protein
MVSKKVNSANWIPEEHGWKMEQIRELEREFEKLPYACINDIAVKFGVYFVESLEGEEKDGLFWTIIADGAEYKKMKAEIQGHIEKCLNKNK